MKRRGSVLSPGEGGMVPISGFLESFKLAGRVGKKKSLMTFLGQILIPFRDLNNEILLAIGDALTG